MAHHLSAADRRTTDRTWQDLPKDCLLKILERVGPESLLMFVPFVCKSWYKASLSPSCWKRLVFPTETEKGTLISPWTFPISTSDDDDHSTSFDYFIRRYSKEFGIEWSRFYVSKLIKFAVNRGQGETQFLKVPGICSHYMNVMRDVLEHIGRSCEGFEGLHMSHALVDGDLAMDIVKYVPKIKYLCLKKGKISRDELVVLIKGCRELKVLDVRGCEGFTEGDKDLVQLGSHIGKFMMEGSRLFRGTWVEIDGVVVVDDD